MRAIVSIAGLVMVTSLAACAQSVSLPDVGLWGSDKAPEQTGTQPAQPPQGQVQAAAQPNKSSTAVSKDGKKNSNAQKGRTQVAAKQPAAAPAPAASAPQAGKQDEKPGLSLGNLAQMSIFSSPASGPDTVHTDAKPVAAYSMLAQQIHACWLAPAAPIMPRLGFHAEVAPNGSGDAKIIIYEKTADNRRGLQVFKITITADGDGSSIASQNHRVDAKLEGTLKADLARWAKGDQRCKG